MLTQLIEYLSKQLPPECLLTEHQQRVAFECDALSVYTALPGLVVLARSEADVIATVKACAQFNVPLVSRGAGTGVSAGALPHEEGVLLVTARMNRILSLDADALIARLEPGVVNARISEAARAHQCYYAPDPSSQIACSIGGNVAENAGGVHCLKYGVTVNNVIGARLVNVEGQVLLLGGQTMAQPGFDLLALVHGSEGCLGVVTEITVRLTPLPSLTRTLLAEFADVRSACDAVSKVIASGVIPAALEMMDALAIRATEAFCQPGYGADAQAVLLVDLDGDPDEVAVEIALTRELLATSGAHIVREASTEAERLRWWKGRKSAFPAIGRLSPDYYCIDGTVPRGRIGDLLDFIGAAARKYQLQVANVFHAGDGNLHPIIMFDNSVAGELERTEQLAGEILEACIDVGGTITGEHGVGVEKIKQMASQFSEPEIAQMLALKSALDENNLLNPGKLIPSLARCREYRLLRQS